MAALAGGLRTSCFHSVYRYDLQRGVCSIYELQAFIVTLVSQFEFGLSEDCNKIRRELCAVMVPTIEGDTKAVNLPLTISLVTQD